MDKFKKVIFCGDFNSLPNSNVYQLLSIGKTTYPYYGNLIIKRKFDSSYKLLHGIEDNITTHTSNITTPIFSETIDYIWLTPNITPINSYKVVNTDKIKNKNFMPNKSQPSDHFLLMVLLKIQ